MCRSDLQGRRCHATAGAPHGIRHPRVTVLVLVLVREYLVRGVGKPAGTAQPLAKRVLAARKVLGLTSLQAGTLGTCQFSE